MYSESRRTVHLIIRSLVSYSVLRLQYAENLIIWGSFIMDPPSVQKQEFCYHIKMPSNEGFDILNFNVKIDTSWIFQELEDASVPDEQVHSAGEENLDLRIKELEKSEQKLRDVLEDYMKSDSVIRNR